MNEMQVKENPMARAARDASIESRRVQDEIESAKERELKAESLAAEREAQP